MVLTPGVRLQPPPLALIVVGTLVFLLGCIWPAIMFDDFQNERDASSWPTTNATVVEMDIEIYEYQCGDSQNPGTCLEYIVEYHLQYTINGTIFDVEESEKVSLGRVGRWWLQRRQCRRTQDDLGSRSRARGSFSLLLERGHSQQGAAMSKQTSSRGQLRVRSGRG